MSKHIKRFSAPKHWGLRTKEATFAVKPLPGPHPEELGIPLLGLVRDYLGYAQNASEAKKVIVEGNIAVDHIVRKDYKYPAGLMDVVTVLKTKENYRLLPGPNGLRLQPISATEAKTKLLRISGKSLVKGGQVQLNLHDGSNMVIDPKKARSYRTGDVIQVRLPDREIRDHLSVETGNVAIVYKGKRRGEVGTIQAIEAGEGTQPTLVTLTSDGSEFQTLFDYIFVIGRKRPKIKVE